MKIFKIIIVTLLTLVLMTACSSSPDYSETNKHIQAQGIELGLDVNTVFETLKDQPEEEMCVYGYEYFFEKAGLNIGFRLDNDTVRRVTVRNSKDSIYDIHVGDDLASVAEIITSYGFSEDKTVAGRYVKDKLYFTPVSKDGAIIHQLIIEVIDEGVL